MCRTLRTLGPGPRPVPPLAARWHLGPARHPTPGPGRRPRLDHLGRERRLHGLQGPPARRGGVEKGDLQKEPPGSIAVEPADHGLGRSRGRLTTKVHLAAEQGQEPLSVLITAGQRGDSPQFEPVLEAIGVPRLGAGRPRSRPDGCGWTGLDGRFQPPTAFATGPGGVPSRTGGAGAPVTPGLTTVGTVRLLCQGRHSYRTSGSRSSLPLPSVRSTATKPWRS